MGSEKSLSSPKKASTVSVRMEMEKACPHPRKQTGDSARTESKGGLSSPEETSSSLILARGNR